PMHVLGTPMLVTDYSRLQTQCLEWARGSKCVAMDFANTQIVTMRRHEQDFLNLTSAYDCFPPDGMPLIWCMNRAGAGLRDRVYGPTFMRHFLAGAPADATHYLLGGSQACGDKLRQNFAQLNPSVRFLGSFHGRCHLDGTLDGAAEQEVI